MESDNKDIGFVIYNIGGSSGVNEYQAGGVRWIRMQ
jgi:hypothetical protein